MLITIIYSYRFPIPGFLVSILPISKREKKLVPEPGGFLRMFHFILLYFLS